MTPDALRRFAAATEVIREPEQLRTYECDGLTGHRVVPALVALPGSVEEVQAVVRICNDEGLPFVANDMRLTLTTNAALGNYNILSENLEGVDPAAG